MTSALFHFKSYSSDDRASSLLSRHFFEPAEIFSRVLPEGWAAIPDRVRQSRFCLSHFLCHEHKPNLSGAN
jgi:hypothetical protein